AHGSFSAVGKPCRAPSRMRRCCGEITAARKRSLGRPIPTPKVLHCALSVRFPALGLGPDRWCEDESIYSTCPCLDEGVVSEKRQQGEPCGMASHYPMATTFLHHQVLFSWRRPHTKRVSPVIT